MKSIKNIFSVLAFVLFFSLAITACKKTSEEGGSTGSSSGTSADNPVPTGDPRAVSFRYALPSLIQQLNPSASDSERFTPDQILRGSLYVLNTDDSSNQTIDWTVYLDETDYSAQSNKTLILAPANYEFSLLLTSGTRQYAGNAVQAIIDGENDVAMTIRPVIGETITDVTIIDRIFDLRFQYDTAELTGIITPQLGVLIDSDPTENLLTIDPATGLTNTYISLEPGTHTLKLKFYDGSTQRGRSIPAQESVNIAQGNTYTMDIVALQGETNFTLTEDGGPADFKFNIPSEVVEETGDTSNLEVLFSIVSPKNPLREIVLTVDPSNDAYYAEETLTDYQYDTVSFTLTFTQLSDSKQIGECTNPGIVLDVNTETVNCDITLRRDGIIGGNLLATLGINALNSDGEPVSGASVYANGNLVGITGSGTFGTAGYLRSFLLAGDYQIQTEAADLSFGEEGVSLAPLTIDNLELDLAGQSIPTNGAMNWESFQIGTDTFLAVANYYNGTHNLDSKIYQWNGQRFLEFQAISTNGAFDWEAFQIGTDHYLVVANYSNDSTANINSKIYKWNGTNFQEDQLISTIGAFDWEFFQIGTGYYLAVANYEGVESKIYKWDGQSFLEFQSIPTSGAYDWESFQIGTDHYLAVANHFNGSHGNIDSKIYQWNGASFQEFQSISSNSAIDWKFFEIGTAYYLALANYYNGSTRNIDSKIYQWDGQNFQEFQSIGTNGAFNWESFQFGTEHYLAVANYNNNATYNLNSNLYKWDGTVFQEFSSFRTAGAKDWEFFQIGTDSFLAVANNHNGSTFDLNSRVYKLDPDSL